MPLFAQQIPRYVRDDAVAVHVRRTALRGAQQACTVTLAVCSGHGAKCPLPMLVAVEVALPVRVAADFANIHTSALAGCWPSTWCRALTCG